MTLKYDSQEILQTLRGNLDLKKKVFVYNTIFRFYNINHKKYCSKVSRPGSNSLYYPKG